MGKEPRRPRIWKTALWAKALIRLSEKIKQMFPRLPIVLASDGLYPKDNVFKPCASNGWRFIITFKNGNLPSVWEEVPLLKKAGALVKVKTSDLVGQNTIFTEYGFLKSIGYKTHIIIFLEANITKTGLKKDKASCKERFVHVTDLEITNKNCKTICDYGRLR